MNTMSAHVCSPIYEKEESIDFDCPVCGSTQKAWVGYEAWHGSTTACLGCGNIWPEDGMYMFRQTEEQRKTNISWYSKRALELENKK